MADHETIGELLTAGDWPAIVEAVGETPELLEARFGWAEQTLLHHAVIAGEREAVVALLDAGADIMARDAADNATPLHWAADRGNLELARLLVERGADLNASDDAHGWGPLGWAALGETSEDVARWLLEAGARPRLFPLIALDDGPAVAALLAERPRALDDRMSLWEHYECPLHFAIARGATASFAALLDAGADLVSLDWLGLSPLAVAGFYGRDDLAVHLEARRVEPDLSAALAAGDYETAERALSAEPGALKPKARYGRLLMFAAENDFADTVRWLLEHDADPNVVRDWWDNRLTPLHTAASHGSTDVVRLLLDHGADPTVRDHVFDAAPVEWARYYERSDVVAILDATPAVGTLGETESEEE